MFTTPSAVPTAAAVVVRPSFQMINTTSTASNNPSWRSTGPTVVSILNGNSPPIYIATQPSTTATSAANLLRPSPQTGRIVSSSLTLINNSNAVLTGQVPVLSTPINSLQPGICIDRPALGRLANQPEEQVRETE